MSKIKMRCTTCGKWFQSANAKEVTCPDCVLKARKEKLAAKAAQPASSLKPGQVGQGTVSSPKPLPPPKPKQASGGTSHWIDTVEDVKVSQPEQPKPKLPSSPVQRDKRGETTTEKPGSRGPGAYREGSNRGPRDYRPVEHSIFGGIGQRPRQPMEGGVSRSPRPGSGEESRSDRYRPDGKKGSKPPKAKVPKPPTPPKPKREKIPPPAPFVPSSEQITWVETRYLELALPTEFDGIRTQIAQEIGIPKKAVKRIVKDLRERQSIPSWWELQTYQGSSEELEKIKAAYVPHLPLPQIGIHKIIADELALNPGEVYQAIKAIRKEMNLPQYNNPSLHGIEPITGDKQRLVTAEKEKKEPQEDTSESKEVAIEIQNGQAEVEMVSREIPVEPAEVAISPVVDTNDAQAQ
jgi:transposase-like protein